MKRGYKELHMTWVHNGEVDKYGFFFPRRQFSVKTKGEYGGGRHPQGKT